MRKRFQLVITAIACAGMIACAGSESDGTETAELTRGQKDTIISKLPIRGSRGVGRALEAVERSHVRALEHDSIG